MAEPTLPKNTITPEMNWETTAHINTAPEAEAAVWADLGNLTKNMAQALNEVLYQATYWANKGWGSTEVTGAQMTLTLTGDVKPDDEACTYILSDKVMYGLGAARKTHLKLQKGDKVIIWPVTLANITPAYGDSAAVNALTVTIHGNGRPTIGTGA
ncbi:phage tail tube protein [Blautia producta]|uniref:phage tail tube protein n=3 Tax=Blautia producta TaxID=33035 RepID=UPI0031B5D2A3